jgi:hypothetical protein
MRVEATAIPACPRPARCTVAIDQFQEVFSRSADSLREYELEPREPVYRIYSAEDGFHQANPGLGSTRFAPFPDEKGRFMVPSMYVAESLAAALLETAFHNVDHRMPAHDRVVFSSDLLGRLQARVRPPRPLRLLDLRDDALDKLGVQRQGVVTSSAAHYPCTRRVAQLAHRVTNFGGPFDGIVWHSRQAELAGVEPVEVAVLFCDRVPEGRGSGWTLVEAPDSSGALLEGAGLERVDELATRLGITLELGIES